MKKILTTPLIILTVLAGVLHGYHEFQQEKKDKESSSPTEPEEQNPPTKVTPDPDRDKDKDKPKKEDPPKEKDPLAAKFSYKKVNHLFNQAGADFESMDYMKAAQKLKKSLRLLATQGIEKDGRLHFVDPKYKKLYQMMDRLLKRSLVYHSLIHNIHPRPASELKKPYLIHFQGGGKVLALRYRKVQDQAAFFPLAILAEKGVPESVNPDEQVLISSSSIVKGEELTSEKYKEVAREYIETQGTQTSSGDFMANYRIIFFCVKNRLFDPVSRLITKVLRGKNGILLLEAFATHPVYDIHLLKYFWLYSEGLADGLRMSKSSITPTNRIRPSPDRDRGEEKNTGDKEKRPDEGRPKQPVQRQPDQRPVVELSSTLKAKVEKARATFKEGMEYFRKIYRVKGKAREPLIEKALEKFRNARRLYLEVSREEPNLAGLQETLNRLGKLIYDCQKMSGF